MLRVFVAAFAAVLLFTTFAQQHAPVASDALPDIAQLDARAASAVDSQTVVGEDALAQSAGAIEIGTYLYLTSGAGGSEWAIYRLTPPAGFTPETLEVLLDDGATDEVWIAMARFDSGRWEHSGPHAGTMTFFPHPLNDYLSSGGHFYVAVICSGANSTIIQSVSLDSSGNAPPVASFTATPQTGSPGEPVTLDASSSSDPDGTIAKYEWDLNGDGSFELDNGLIPTAPTTLPDPAGSVMVALRITDDLGSTGTTTLTLTSQVSNPVGPVAIGDPGLPQAGIKMLVVNGRPAIVYTDWDAHLKYVRALDSAGESWGSPLTLNAENSGHPGFAIIGGRPAVSYRNPAGVNKQVTYVVASDSNGDNWGPPVDVLAPQSVNQVTALAEVSGHPAIIWPTTTAGMRYVRAADPEGLTWGTAETPETDDISGYLLNMQVVNGNPAFSYLVNRAGTTVVAYVRASDTDGNNWNAPVDVFSNDCIIGSSLAVVAGNPAILFVEAAGRNARFVRAEDTSGTSWGQPLAIGTIPDDGLSGHGTLSALSVVGGFPAAAYGIGGGDISYVSAEDADGSVWSLPITVASSEWGNAPWPSLAEVGGAPAVAYRSGQENDSDIWYKKLY